MDARTNLQPIPLQSPAQLLVLRGGDPEREVMQDPLGLRAREGQALRMNHQHDHVGNPELTV